MTPLRFSVVMPTYQRRNVVLASVCALAHQQFDSLFELIVVVDGSDDGSAEALRELAPPFPLTVLEQPNRGAATGRNRGAAAARGEILLFLDDDMEAHPRLLVEHDRSHREGADVVLGHVPLHPNSPAGFLSTAVRSWADRRGLRLSAPGARLGLQDLITGQISLRRDKFEEIGGFDTAFTHGGSFGNEDIDFGYRLLRKNYKIVFNANAISWQYYVVQPRQYLRQWRQAGQADVLLVRKYPDQAKAIFYRANRRLDRYLWRPLVSVPLLAIPVAAVLKWVTLRLAESGAQGSITTKLFFETKNLEYWRGVREAGDIPRPWPLRVLAYHAIADLTGAPLLESYGIPPEVFQRQLSALLKLGYHFIDGDEFLRFLCCDGCLPRKPLLLTFDDGYEDLLDVVLPILQDRRVPAVAFVVSGRLGGHNDWDQTIGAAQLRLLDVDSLRKLARGGIEIGAHSRTHRPLTQVPAEELSGEIAGSVAELETFGLRRPRFFAYPHGDYGRQTEKTAREAGLQAAFTVDPGLVYAGQDPYRISRVEVLRGDMGRRFLRKVAQAGRQSRIAAAVQAIRQGLRSRLAFREDSV